MVLEGPWGGNGIRLRSSIVLGAAADSDAVLGESEMKSIVCCGFTLTSFYSWSE